jgi:hypothetical protein
MFVGNRENSCSDRIMKEFEIGVAAIAGLLLSLHCFFVGFSNIFVCFSNTKTG